MAALCVAAALAYVQRNSYGGADTTITRELGLTEGQRGDAASLFFLSHALLQAPSGWLAQRVGVARGRPFGQVAWTEEAARRLGLEASLRPRGRPRKAVEGQPTLHLGEGTEG